eukprot:TRINITY_DN9273_c0_g1_i1.p1 TRINITY_DN9273_c0_g1~~TRINITY_DN9273_c0_g1_i1.p1  ORF type:complete len:228 (+),score=6.12 TRINITY_DN9273_c0_g1_i1:84-767(+)
MSSGPYIVPSNQYSSNVNPGGNAQDNMAYNMYAQPINHGGYQNFNQPIANQNENNPSDKTTLYLFLMWGLLILQVVVMVNRFADLSKVSGECPFGVISFTLGLLSDVLMMLAVVYTTTNRIAKVPVVKNRAQNVLMASLVVVFLSVIFQFIGFNACYVYDFTLKSISRTSTAVALQGGGFTLCYFVVSYLSAQIQSQVCSPSFQYDRKRRRLFIFMFDETICVTMLD